MNACGTAPRETCMRPHVRGELAGVEVAIPAETEAEVSLWVNAGSPATLHHHEVFMRPIGVNRVLEPCPKRTGALRLRVRRVSDTETSPYNEYEAIDMLRTQVNNLEDQVSTLCRVHQDQTPNYCDKRHQCATTRAANCSYLAVTNATHEAPAMFPVPVNARGSGAARAPRRAAGHA